MGLLDPFKNRREGRRHDEAAERVRVPERPDGERRSLSNEEREQLIEKTRSDLPELDRKVEENLVRLRDLSKSSKS